jgi:hypothetical protein
MMTGVRMKKYLTGTGQFLRLSGLSFVAAFCFCAGDALAAGSMRCNHRVVDQGMPADEVRKLCGEPASMEDGGNTWIYDFGPGEQLKVVKFVANKVEFIDERSRD